MVDIKTDNVQSLFDAVEALTENELLAGVPAAETDRYIVTRPGEETNDEGADYMTNAEIMYIQEFGSPEANIPARPVVEPGVERVKDRVVKRMNRAARVAIRGDLQRVHQELNSVGLIVQNSMRGMIREGLEPPLSERTLAERRKRGRTGERPLYDTGQLVNSLTYVIRNSGDA